MGAEVATPSDEETRAARPGPDWGQDSGPSSLAGPVFSAITLAVEPVAHLPPGLASSRWLVPPPGGWCRPSQGWVCCPSNVTLDL